jgi:hypothetical protein
MWRTPTGIRVATGPESVLFRKTIEMMIDEMVTELDCEELDDMQTTYRVRVFDDLPMMQRLGLLHEVAKALLLEDVPPPKLTSVSEGTIAAIINNVEQLIWFEIDSEGLSVDEVPRDQRYWRGLLLACTNTEESDALSCENDDRIDVTSSEYGDWEIEIQVLADEFLWDIDFEYTDIPDMAPEQAEFEREALDIDRDYYTSLPPDPDEDEFESPVERVRLLCRNVAP